ncbi:MAG: hypothetical protein F6J93_35280 [Oscillatoria sp. SIO1A7]|nr:hypothetical protein [Oscillatoria sp. SIO1A7]
MSFIAAVSGQRSAVSGARSAEARSVGQRVCASACHSPKSLSAQYLIKLTIAG